MHTEPERYFPSSQLSVGSGVGPGVGTSVSTIVAVGAVVGNEVSEQKEAPERETLPTGQTKHDLDLPQGEYCPTGHDAQAAPV
jgi:hypothetical protein